MYYSWMTTLPGGCYSYYYNHRVYSHRFTVNHHVPTYIYTMPHSPDTVIIPLEVWLLIQFLGYPFPIRPDSFHGIVFLLVCPLYGRNNDGVSYERMVTGTVS